jgi:hypothetical protein
MRHPVLLHLREHTWLWVAGLAAVGVLAAVLKFSTPAALLFMAVGLLIIFKSQGTDLLTIVTADPLDPEEGKPASASASTTPVRDGAPKPASDEMVARP